MKLSTLQIRYISILLLIVMLIQSFTPYVPVLDREEQNGEKREKRESILSEISPDKNRKTHLRKVSGKEVSLAETQDISSEETVQTVIYRSPQQEGIIGLTAGKNFDNPEDNHFTIELNKVPTKGQKIYLSYELYGVSDKSGISRSINDRLSRGGYQVTTNHSWSRQKEELDADWLTAGKNHIRFSIPSGADWGYIIKNLTLEIESPEAERSEDETKETVVVTSCIQSGEETYVRGFIKNPSPGNTGKSLTLNGKPVSLYEGEFEVVLSEKVSEIQLNLNGEPLQQTIISTPVSDRPDYRYPLNLQITQTRKTFRQNTADNKLELSGAVLEVLGSRLLSDKELSLQTLRSQDLPALEMSMENVTAQAEGYRFLPHGEHFKEEGAVVKLTYDRTKIPNGYNEQDIRTFYFDPDTRHWVALERDSLDIQNQEVISRTTHFTDMINGILKTPESPETAGFTPTQMSDIKAADPTAKVQLISPPGVNNRGSANLSYSFELPPARNGMSPSLGIQYSSDGGSGLLGEGWDLNIPGITVDTRWGVPRYDLSKETEVYLLDGTQLMTRDSQGNNYLAHRKEKISREANRLFFSRKEGSFSKIQRKGNSPGNYVWEVTDRKGVKYTYGGNNGSMKGIYIDVKQQAREVISQWRLSRVEELHGDWIEYIYERVDEPVRGGLTSKALYLKEIHAGNKGESAHTVIKLLREATKQKQTSNAGYGYLSSSNRLLTKIEIEFESEKLREYEFQYKPGAFHTDLLDKIVQKDGKGEEFNSHRFEYYDDVRSGEYFKGGETWNTRNDGVSGGLVNPVSKLQFNDFSDQTTALGGNKSTSVSGSMYVGVGSLGSTFLKSLTAGASFNYSYSEGQGLSTLADINGDGIPDKIFKSNGSLYYRGGSRSGNFGPSIKIENLNEFSTTYSNSTSYGGKFFFGVQTGTDQQTTKTQISRYFSDVNADGLMDMVVGGSTVYFNHIEKDPQGNLVPTFTTSSGDTPSPINGGGIIDDSDTAVDPEEQAELIEDHPLQDVVRIWTAPCDGKVNITGSATLQQPQSGAKPANDGVRLTIQHNTTKNVFTQPILYPTILKSREIGATDHSAKDMSHNGLEVKAGDRLYFRVQSGTEEDSNGENDRVNWSPQVSYTTAIPQDPNGYSQNYSSSSAIVSDEGILLVPVKDSYTIKGKFIKPVTTDSLTLKILLGTEVVYEQTYTDQQTYNGELTLPLTNDKQADQIQFILESSSAIAWDKIHWNPKVSYTDIIENTLVETESPGSVKYKGVYPRVFRYGEPQTVKNAGTAKLITGIDFNSGTTQKQKEAVEGSYTLTVKKQTGIIYKGLVEIKKGKITQGDSIQIPLPAGKLWVELFSDDPNIKLDSVKYLQTRITDTLNIQTQSISGVYHTTDEQRFGPLHRGWGQFSYNSMEGRVLLPIQEQLLNFPKEESESDPRKMVFIPMSLDIETRSHWKGIDSQVYIDGNIMSSSRLGQKDVKLDNPLSGLSSGTASPSGSCITGGGAIGVRQESKSTSTADMIGGSFGLNVSISEAEGRDEQLLSFGDMNGDGYPDIISKGQIQYTNTRGGFDGEILPHDGYHRSRSQSRSTGTGGNPVHASTISAKEADLNNAVNKLSAAQTALSEAKGKAKDNPTDSGIQTAIENAQTTVTSASASVGQAQEALDNAKLVPYWTPSLDHNKSSDEAVSTYMDINGDGLPDKILSNKQVQLNLGYSFAPPVYWELDKVQEGSSQTTSPAVSRNYDKGASSWSGGIGISLTTTQSDFTMMDINSDGLVDKIRISNEGISAVHVSLNKGNGFAPEQLWAILSSVQKSSSVGESLNGSATFGFEIPPVTPAIRIVINPGTNVGHSMSRTLSDLRDVDGDGYIDAVYSDKEQELEVKRSTIGRTNKLRTVRNPLGGSFTLDYARTEATYDHPGGKWVLSSVDTDDGVHDDGANIRVEYTYSRGRHDRHEREFLGFGEVESRSVHNAQTYRRTLQQYDTNSYYTSGNLLYSRMEDAQGKPYTETLNKYYVYEVKQTGAGNYILTPADLCSDVQSSYTPMKYTQSKIYEGKPAGIVAGESWYSYDITDQYGELLQYKYSDTGTLGENGNGGYTYKTLIAYTSNPAKYIFGLPSSVTVTGSDGKTYRQVSADYDINYSNHLTKITQKLNEQGEEAVTDITYDKYGNITQKTLPKNHKGERMWYKYRYDSDYHMYLQRIDDAYGYTSELENYDYRYGIPLSSKDINGYFMETAIDDLGRVVTITGPNEMELGLPYTLKFEYSPKAVVNAQGEITQPAYAVTKHYDPQHPGDDIETVSFVDGAGRALQVKKEGIVTTTDGGEPQDAEVWIVSGRSKYDPWGRVTESYYPLTENKSQKLIFNKNFDAVTPTRMQYDPLDRVIKTTLPDGSISTVSYDLDTSARTLVTTTTDALGGKQKTYANPRGLTVKTEQLSGPDGVITTRFQYDQINRLLEVTDTQGQKTTSVYDMGGRRIHLEHPAAGTTRLTYDPLGNVISRQTSNLEKNNQKIKYEYQYTRLTKVQYPDHPENNVTYYYGGKNAKENRVGRIILQEDATGAQEFKYGTLGEITEVRRTVVIPNQAVATYVTKTRYDSWNRIEQIIYPDEEKVEYTYNTAGLLTGVKGSKSYSYNYVNKIGYDKFEQRNYLKYCNGAETTYSYDPQRRRLSSLQVWTQPNNNGAATGAKKQILNNHYSYDEVSNVLSVENLAPLPQGGQNNPGGQMSHNYSYDGLYRLVGASGTYSGADGKTAEYTLNMEYDNLHNPVKKIQEVSQNNIVFNGGLEAGYALTYNYDSEKRNQIKTIEDQNHRTETGQAAENRAQEQIWQYDPNGNLLYVSTSLKKQDNSYSEKTHERKLMWDEENRLRSIDDNGYVSSYWYDGSGERVVKTHGEGEQMYVNSGFAGGRTGTTQFTAYISPYLVVSPNGKYTKHYYIGSQRIVSKLGDIESFGADPRRIEYAGAGVDGISIDWKAKYQQGIQDIKDNYEYFEVPYNGTDNDDYVNGQGFCCSNPTAGKAADGGIGIGNVNYEKLQYYYHADHLGSSSYITNLDGEIVQHVEYVPFGEVFIEERNNTWNTPYLFNGKELDEETGLYYYGARYYNPRESVWLSVDALASYNPFEQENFIDGQHNGGVYNSFNLTVYGYCYQNPIVLVDPNGKQTVPITLGSVSAGSVGGGIGGGFSLGPGIVIVGLIILQYRVKQSSNRYQANKAKQQERQQQNATLKETKEAIIKEDYPIAKQDNLDIKNFAQHGKNNGKLESEELEHLKAKKEAGTLTKLEQQKLKKHEKNTDQRPSRQSKDKKK